MGSVLVVGGGMAGFAAALSAARTGAKVTLIARAPGATALYAGAMEVAADLAGLAARAPDHPLARLGLDPAALAAEMDEAVTAVTSALAGAGLTFAGDWRRAGTYAGVDGRLRPGSLVPESVAAGEVGALRGRRVAVVHVPALSDYDAPAVAAGLGEAGVDAELVEAGIPDLPPSPSITDLFDRRAPHVASRAALVAFPPGLVGLPKKGFELLAAAPSPHGWRLQGAISRALEQAGIEVHSGVADGFRTEAGSVVAVVADGRQWTAGGFVLATGRFIGGGLVKVGTVKEPLLGLGVFHEGREVGQDSARLRHLEYLSPEAVLSSGLRTDQRLRPFAADGSPALENLHAAGAVLGGYDSAAGEGFGVPLLTGWLAGRFAAGAEVASR